MNSFDHQKPQAMCYPSGTLRATRLYYGIIGPLGSARRKEFHGLN